MANFRNPSKSHCNSRVAFRVLPAVRCGGTQTRMEECFMASEQRTGLQFEAFQIDVVVVEAPLPLDSALTRCGFVRAI